MGRFRVMEADVRVTLTRLCNVGKVNSGRDLCPSWLFGHAGEIVADARPILSGGKWTSIFVDGLMAPINRLGLHTDTPTHSKRPIQLSPIKAPFNQLKQLSH